MKDLNYFKEKLNNLKLELISELGLIADESEDGLIILNNPIKYGEGKIQGFNDSNDIEVRQDSGLLEIIAARDLDIQYLMKIFKEVERMRGKTDVSTFCGNY